MIGDVNVRSLSYFEIRFSDISEHTAKKKKKKKEKLTVP
jgi:hypothetical protein